MRLFLITIWLCLAIGAMGQNKNLIERRVLKFCPTAHIIEIEEKYGFTEVDFICEGSNCEMILDSALNIVSTEKEIPVDELSVKIKKRIEKKYAAWQIDEAALIESGKFKTTKVELLKDGFEQTLYFSIDDKLMKNMEATASLDFSSRQLSTLPIYSTLEYNFFEPTKQFDMPEILTEISGIALASDHLILCIQDELGVIFEYNTNSEEVERIMRFADVGDYEDLMILNDTIWTLRSDGLIFTLPYKNFNGKSESNYFPFQALELEGLCYNKHANSTLVVTKTNVVGKSQNDKVVYAVSPNGAVSKYLQIKETEIAQMFHTNFGTIGQSSVTFQPSAIAVHPLTKDLYILSATDRMLAIYTSELQLKTVIALPTDSFYKPEGIAFMGNGDLLISSEGKKDGSLPGEIQLFEMKR